MNGTLFVVACPIGNLEDLTLRARRTLSEVDFVICEDTRRTGQLLAHLGIKKPLFALFAPKEKQRSGQALQRILSGETAALLSDAGTPAVADPGALLVEKARAAEVKIVPVPGASSVAAAVSVSGLAHRGYTFIGFLPRSAGRIRREIAEALTAERAVVFFESPYRVLSTLELLQSVYGEELHCFLAREMTKQFEEFLSGSLAQVHAALSAKKVLGEFTIILEKKRAAKAPSAEFNFKF